MAEKLRSLGLDVGTTTTQLILSELTVENKAGAFAVPQMQITNRKILYKSPVYFTPLSDESHVDGAAIRKIVEKEYAQAGIDRTEIHTGAIIITGETSRKENARRVLEELSGFAGDFVVATAGPDLESALAAKGAGAVQYSQDTGKTVLHMDIGGGTANLALVEKGRIVSTGCLNVGGRLIKRSNSGQITYISPVLKGRTHLAVGDTPSVQEIQEIANMLNEALEMAAGLRPATELLTHFLTREAAAPWNIPQAEVISFSGGVADCIQNPTGFFGDIGAELGAAIARGRLCQGQYMLGTETIRATVIGAGSHSTQLSGSTVYYDHVDLPMQNLPVAVLTEWEQQDAHIIRQRIREKDAPIVVLAIPGYDAPHYHQITALADVIYEAVGNDPLFLCTPQDMAKALGHRLSLLRESHAPILCIDRLELSPDSFLDIGHPIGSALPVVIKTLILNQQ